MQTHRTSNTVRLPSETDASSRECDSGALGRHRLQLAVGVQLRIVAYAALRLIDVEHAKVVGQRRRIAAANELRVCGPEVSCRLLQVVVRDLAEQVVDLVGANVVRQFVRPAVVAVDGRQLAAHVRPLVVAVPQHARVHVMQEGDDDEPRAEHEQRRHVVTGERGEAVGACVRSEHGEPASHGADGQRAAENVAGEHRLERIEVAHAARHVAREQVHEPTDAESEGRVDDFEVSRQVALADRVENLVAVDVGRVAVVVSVRQLPRVVWHEQDGVQQRAEHVVEQVMIRERAVPAVMPEHEHRPHECALQEPVDGHRREVQHADRLPLQQQHHAVQRGYQDDVLADKVHGACKDATEAVRRDDLLDVDDGRHVGRSQWLDHIVVAAAAPLSGHRRRRR